MNKESKKVYNLINLQRAWGTAEIQPDIQHKMGGKWRNEPCNI